MGVGLSYYAHGDMTFPQEIHTEKNSVAGLTHTVTDVVELITEKYKEQYQTM